MQSVSGSRDLSPCSYKPTPSTSHFVCDSHKDPGFAVPPTLSLHFALIVIYILSPPSLSVPMYLFSTSLLFFLISLILTAPSILPRLRAKAVPVLEGDNGCQEPAVRATANWKADGSWDWANYEAGTAKLVELLASGAQFIPRHKRVHLLNAGRWHGSRKLIKLWTAFQSWLWSTACDASSSH